MRQMAKQKAKPDIETPLREGRGVARFDPRGCAVSGATPAALAITAVMNGPIERPS